MENGNENGKWKIEKENGNGNENGKMKMENGK